MSETTVALLTPAGSSALAVLSVRGPRAWPVIRALLRTAAGRQFSDPPTSFLFGRIGDGSADEVFVVRVGPESYEVHCHGGRRVVAWLLDLFRANGINEESTELPGPFAIVAERLLPLARTTRTAAILLDQVQGAYDRALAAIDAGDADTVSILRRNSRVGRHLVEPWTVALAGLPNAGKSSLFNGLAGFARSIVSPVPGTTRDAVSVSVAFDGWPVKLIDTAGMRESADDLEAQGVGRARSAAASSDLVLWVVDATGPRPASVAAAAADGAVDADRTVVVFNKMDATNVPAAEFPEAVRLSATTGAGLSELVARLVTKLIPDPAVPGEPVPLTPAECDRWSAS
jgi:tRNA modification GTPase